MGMHRRHIVKVTSEGSSYRVTLPRAIVNSAGVQMADYLGCVVVGKCLVFVPIGDIVDQRVAIASKELLDKLIGVPA